MKREISHAQYLLAPVQNSVRACRRIGTNGKKRAGTERSGAGTERSGHGAEREILIWVDHERIKITPF
jgi:hypothetical protein